MLAAGVAFETTYLVLYCTSFLLPAGGEGLPVAYMSALFLGIGDACVIMVSLHLFLAYPPRANAVAVPAAYLLNEVIYLAFMYLGVPQTVVCRGVAKAVGVFLLALCVVRRGREGAVGDVHVTQCGVGSPGVPEEGPGIRVLATSRDWGLLLVGTTLFPFLFGLVHSSAPSVGRRPGSTARGTSLLPSACSWSLSWSGLSSASPSHTTSCLPLPRFSFRPGVS